MTYIIKNTSGLINTRVTDTGRQKMSEGNFNIRYFAIGDSEISYDKLPDNYNQQNTVILEPQFNSQNSNGIPESNRQYIKFPYLVDENQTNIYGIPFMDSVIDSVYNRASMRGFFTGDTLSNNNNWKVLTNNDYVITPNYVVNMSELDGTNDIKVYRLDCNVLNNNTPSVGDFITIFYDGSGENDCSCVNYPTPTPSASVGLTPTPTPTPSSTSSDPCASPTPTPTPTRTPCLTPSNTPQCPVPPPPTCLKDVNSCYSILTYRIVAVCGDILTLDRPTPNFTNLSNKCVARTLIYPPKMVPLYDSFTPDPHWNKNVIDFESVCGIDEFDVKIWNMNIPWTESPAGLNSNQFKDYTNFGSVNYIGQKEYFGYNSSQGQTSSDDVYYYNSFGEKNVVKPEDQKAIAIIHYTNQTIDLFYGEKFAMEPFDPQNPDNTQGQARNFKLHIPTLMWHKNPECCFGQTFWVDPPGFEGKNLFKVQYIKSNISDNMNKPGIRYYNLWDTFEQPNGLPSRIGKVFPDSKIIVIDDEEIVAALSYKSNRNWTLPAPQVSLITPNTCGVSNTTGVLTGGSETLWVTYRLSNDNEFTNSLHNNYYVGVVGTENVCSPDTPKNVGIRFGGEFGCLVQPNNNPFTTTTTTNNITTTTTTNNITTTTTTENYTTTTTTVCDVCDVPRGFYATKFEVLVQKTLNGVRPNPSQWRIIDFTDQIDEMFINGYITEESLISTTFVVSSENYDQAPIYNLNDYIQLTEIGDNESQLNFGDEYYFYGNLETDIQATIYEMKYKVNLSSSEFLVSQNPTWTPGTPSYVSEIALLNENQDILVMSKLQSPVLRQGIQQYVVKLDF
jgi:hypothetical protein